jgi:hypothetical protein
VPIPIDRHVVRSLGVTDANGKAVDILRRSAYGFVEDLLRRRAWDMGLTPGQYQGALRAGAAEYTGLRSPKPMLTTLDERLRKAADRNNISPAEVLRRLIEEGYKLPSIGILVGVGAGSSTEQKELPEKHERGQKE